MRIHWSLVILAVIGSILVTWHLRTKDMDFLTPRGVDLSESETDSGLVAAPAEIQPEIAPSRVIGEVIAGTSEKPVEPEIPKITERELGDLEAAPGLAEYRSFAESNDHEGLFELSSILRTRGHYQRALLALERIIDTCDPSAEILMEAGQGIAALTPTLARWNVDPKAEISLELFLNLSGPKDDALESSLSDLSLLIRDSSGDQISIVPKIVGSDKTTPSADAPVALWISSLGENPKTSAVITLPLPQSPDSLVPKFSLALFRAIRSHLEPLGFPEAPELDESGPRLLQTQITRLMWRDFALSLTPPVEESEEAQAQSGDDFPDETD